MLKAKCIYHKLNFKCPGGTSRGILTEKDSWFIKVWEETNPDVVGVGECSIIKGLSIDDCAEYQKKIHEVCENIDDYWYYLEEDLKMFPSIRFGLEMAMKDLQNGGKQLLYPSEFTNGKQAININGLIWMADAKTMQKQIEEKIEAGFNCIKLKIGAIDFDEEVKLLEGIRKRFDSKTIELRVDANGAFNSKEAPRKLERLSKLQIHSIEQPIKAGQWEEMAHLCKTTPLPIALDEELIGIYEAEEKEKLLSVIKPQYIILKPSLVGGFKSSEEWIKLADEQGVSWWITSALESNVGLNAIAQWTYTLNNPIPQGLGTGQLFTNNISSPLEIRKDCLFYDNNKLWDLNNIKCST